jgi:uncharacterized protein (DUF2225 family)
VEELPILFDKNITCMACRHPYKTKKVRSRFIRVLRSDSDFCSYYEDEENSPLLYYVSVCPKCGFSLSDEFSTYFPPNSLEAIQKSITDQWVEKNYGLKRSLKGAIEAYKLAIYCATLKKERNIILAGLYMRLVWIYRKANNQEQEQRFIKLAISEYVQSYSNDDFKTTEMSEIKLLYVIGELYKRLGDDKQAMVYLSKVIHRKEGSLEKRMIEMAKDSWAEIRENLRNSQNNLEKLS